MENISKHILITVNKIRPKYHQHITNIIIILQRFSGFSFIFQTYNFKIKPYQSTKISFTSITLSNLHGIWD